MSGLPTVQLTEVVTILWACFRYLPRCSNFDLATLDFSQEVNLGRALESTKSIGQIVDAEITEEVDIVLCSLEFHEILLAALQGWVALLDLWLNMLFLIVHISVFILFRIGDSWNEDWVASSEWLSLERQVLFEELLPELFIGDQLILVLTDFWSHIRLLHKSFHVFLIGLCFSEGLQNLLGFFLEVLEPGLFLITILHGIVLQCFPLLLSDDGVIRKLDFEVFMFGHDRISHKVDLDELLVGCLKLGVLSEKPLAVFFCQCVISLLRLVVHLFG